MVKANYIGCIWSLVLATRHYAWWSRLSVASLALWLVAAPSWSQTNSQAALVIRGDVNVPLSMTPDDLKALPRARVESRGEGTVAHVYEGVLVGTVLMKAGVPLGQTHGNMMQGYVMASASDGYQVLFAVAELDPSFTANQVLIADTVDGQPLPASEGPLRLIAPRDLRSTRWVRGLQQFEVFRVRK
jgi:hypothetical protein